MTRETFKRATRRMLGGRIGDHATVVNYEPETDADGNIEYDDHGDPRRNEVSRMTGVDALFRRPGSVDMDQDNMAGVDQSIDSLVWVVDETDDGTPVEVRNAGGPDGSGGTHHYATRLVDESTGREFDVIDAWDEGNGSWRATCKEV